MLSDFFTNGHTPIKGHVRAQAQTANFTVNQPAGTVLRRIFIRNNTANAVTGGIRIGTAAAGTQILTAGAVAANAVVSLAPSIGNYQADADVLYVEAVTSWNSAEIDIVLEYDKIDA